MVFLSQLLSNPRGLQQMILCYHKIDIETKTKWWLSADTFYRQMIDLQHKKVVYLDDFDPINPNHAVITFDGVYANLTQYALPILKYFGYPFELFIIGKYIGKDNSFDSIEPLTDFASVENLKKMISLGGRLQWHTHSHTRLTGDETQEALEKELSIPQELKTLDPQGFKWFAYPHGDVKPKFRQHVQDSFIGALGTDDGDRNDKFNYPRTTVYEETKLINNTISVIIPCYNYGHFLSEAIESVLYQTYTPDEILVIDDASTDNTQNIASFYEGKINYVRNEKNLGIVENFKKAVSLTKGDYICFLGADNRFRADYVEKCKIVLDSDPNIGIAYNHWIYFGERSGILGVVAANTTQHPIFPEFYYREFPENPDVAIEKQNYIHGSAMYKREAYDQVGGYQTTDKTEDHDLFSRVLNSGWKAKLVNAYILEYRQHSKSQDNRIYVLEVQATLQQKKINDLQRELNKIRNQKPINHSRVYSDRIENFLLTKIHPLLRKIFPKNASHTTVIHKFVLAIKKLIPKGIWGILKIY